ncbi:hypothetical protein DL764_002715 [Monosporascus ibericus]|uniref:Uncharacterized protein n=1 Tax=Monosporascus ibericus TaxID=155417 RepID=A0A4Q4TNG8_9PEZI|nr:hypothetical protein DL764_002715 [Monosporascus ibericus]
MISVIKEDIREARQYQKNRLRRDFLTQTRLGNTPTTVALRAMNLITKERRHMLRSRRWHSQPFTPDPQALQSTAPISTQGVAPQSTTVPGSQPSRLTGLQPSICRNTSQWEHANLEEEDRDDMVLNR